jgi:hypothetical protein
MSDFNKTITGASTFTDGNDIKCTNANITVEKASTAVFAGLEATDKVTLTCTSDFIFGSTLVIDRLTCRDAEINTTTSSTIDIKNFNGKGTVKIHVNNSSTLRIRAGSLNVITGLVEHASTGVCRASITSDEVTTQSASTWDAKRDKSDNHDGPIA